VSVTPLQEISVGVVVERRKADSPWIDFTWRAVTVLPGEPAAAPWTKLADQGDVTTYYAGAANIDLYPSETGNYRDNLAVAVPSLWVALRPTGIEPPYELVAVTADPAEGEGFTQNGDHLVDVVPMPEPVRKVIETFIAEHHVERPLYKRKRDRADPEALARRAPTVKGRGP
jgi:hypothetical protein